MRLPHLPFRNSKYKTPPIESSTTSPPELIEVEIDPQELQRLLFNISPKPLNIKKVEIIGGIYHSKLSFIPDSLYNQPVSKLIKEKRTITQGFMFQNIWGSFSPLNHHIYLFPDSIALSHTNIKIISNHKPNHLSPEEIFIQVITEVLTDTLVEEVVHSQQTVTNFKLHSSYQLIPLGFTTLFLILILLTHFYPPLSEIKQIIFYASVFSVILIFIPLIGHLIPQTSEYFYTINPLEVDAKYKKYQKKIRGNIKHLIKVNLKVPYQKTVEYSNQLYP